jgi:hypothetical protein
MSVPLLNAAGRQRAPVTLPGYLAGRPPRTRDCATRPILPRSRRSSRLCARPATVTMAPACGPSSCCSGGRGCASTRRSPSPIDLDPRLGAILVRHGKGGRRREVGMDPWGWEHLRPWLELRMAMPVGPLLCVLDGPTRGRPWASDAARAQLRRVAAKAGVRRRFAPHQLRHAHAVELAHEGVPFNVIQRQLGHTNRASSSGRESER